MLFRPVRYNSLLFKNSLLDCEFVDMPVAAGAGGLDARPMDPVFSRASLNASQVMVVLTLLLVACTVLNTTGLSYHDAVFPLYFAVDNEKDLATRRFLPHRRKPLFTARAKKAIYRLRTNAGKKQALHASRDAWLMVATARVRRQDMHIFVFYVTAHTLHVHIQT